MKLKKILLIVITIFLALPAIQSFSQSNSEHKSIINNGNQEYLTYLNKKKLKNKDPEKKKETKFFFLPFGTINFGQVTYYPYKPVPEGEDPSLYTSAFGPNPAEPYDFSYGFGISIDYRIQKFLALSMDGGFNTWKLKLANKDGYSYGQWVAEQTNYNTAVIGPFTMDTYYYMDCTSIRMGARYIFSEEIFQPWAGAALGFFAWQATVGNRKESLKYGTPDSGFSPGYSLLAGVDIVIKDITFRVFGDYGSALAKPRITGLLGDYPDAVFENTGGEHATGPYKIGCALGIKY